MADERDSDARDDSKQVMITFGPCGELRFDPPGTLEVANAIKPEIDAGIRMANMAHIEAMVRDSRASCQGIMRRITTVISM